jgi:hypothetical protein
VLHRAIQSSVTINPLHAEVNPICHLLVLLEDLTFMGTCIVSIFQYISNEMQRYTVYLYLETGQHVSDGTSTHHEERIQLYLQHLVFVTPLLLSTAIVEELEPTGSSVLWVAYATHSTLKPVPNLQFFITRQSTSRSFKRSLPYSFLAKVL